MKMVEDVKEEMLREKQLELSGREKIKFGKEGREFSKPVILEVRGGRGRMERTIQIKFTHFFDQEKRAKPLCVGVGGGGWTVCQPQRSLSVDIWIVSLSLYSNSY